MRKFDEIANPASCLNRALQDEPVFVLRARDPAAAETIRAWCDFRAGLGANKPGDAKIKEAQAAALEFDRYRDALPPKARQS